MFQIPEKVGVGFFTLINQKYVVPYTQSASWLQVSQVLVVLVYNLFILAVFRVLMKPDSPDTRTDMNICRLQWSNNLHCRR